MGHTIYVPTIHVHLRACGSDHAVKSQGYHWRVSHGNRIRDSNRILQPDDREQVQTDSTVIFQLAPAICYYFGRLCENLENETVEKFIFPWNTLVSIESY